MGVRAVYFLRRIQHWARVNPSRIAHISGEERLTYGDLWERSDDLAAWLIQAQPGDRSPVIVRGHKEPGMLIGFLAALKAGRPYIPVDLSTPPERAERIERAAGATQVLLAAALPAVRGQGLIASHRIVPDDLAYIIYTSGSTGEPKGVEITGGCLDSFLDWLLAEQRFASGSEIFLNQAPFSFDLSVMDLYGALSTGGTLFSLQRADLENPRRLFERLPESGVTTWVSTPSFALLCLAERRFDREMLPALRRFLFCGETLPHHVASALLDRFPRAEVWNLYGPTEATVATTSVKVDHDLLARCNPLPVGFPKRDATVAIIGPDGEPLPAGEQGEILIAGPHISLGYRGDPAGTARAFTQVGSYRAYRTGDLGRFQDSMLFFEGRIDNQVKLHGYRIELGDIEAHLRALPAVQDALVIPVTREGRVEWLAAFVIPTEPPTGEAGDFARAQRLREALAERLPSYMLPRKILFLAQFPLTPNGKADRQALAAQLQ